MDKACVGCGAQLQSLDQTAPGYVPESRVEADGVLCRRCFRIRHYGDFTPVTVSESDYQAQVAQIFDRPGLVLYVVDVFDLAGSLVPNLARFVLTSEVVVVVNKTDLLPDGVHVESLRDWISSQIELTKVPVTDLYFISAEKSEGTDDLFQLVAKQVNRPVYVVGMANTGKSTLLNAIAKFFSSDVTEPYTVSRRPGTTLKLSHLPLEGPLGQIDLVDTPGLIHGNRVVDKLCADCLSLVVPSTTVRPRVYQLNPEQTLFLGGIARIDFKSGVRQPIVVYVSNDLPVHRSKLERANLIATTHEDDILQVPCERCRPSFGTLTKHPVQSVRMRQSVPKGTIAISGRGRDIVIPGLGWITLSGKPFEGDLWVPSWLDIAFRPRLIGDLSRRNLVHPPYKNRN